MDKEATHATHLSLEQMMALVEEADLPEPSPGAEGSGIGGCHQGFRDTTQSSNRGEASSHHGSNDYPSPSYEASSQTPYSRSYDHSNFSYDIPQGEKEDIWRGLEYFASSIAYWEDSAIEKLFRSKIKSGEGVLYALKYVKTMENENKFKSLDKRDQSIKILNVVAESYPIDV